MNLPRFRLLLTYISLRCTLMVTSCRRSPYKLVTHFADAVSPTAPDYSRSENWSALPDRLDLADSVPAKSGQRDGQAGARADVFFVHPTTYTYQPDAKAVSQWNASLDDATLNRRTDETTILNQASIFNGSGRVYAPRYRQAHYHAFITKSKEDRTGSLNLAYSDVRAAFQYYLSNYNQGRPIIIASHSQGTTHATRLLTEFFDNQPLRKQLVAAYLVGVAIPPDQFKTIPPGDSATQTGCFVSWNTFARGYVPDYYQNGLNRALCTNPLTWNPTNTYAPRSLNTGGVGYNYKYKTRLVDAQVHQGLLWVRKPRVFGTFLVPVNIWHIADYNFYWQNVRDNVADRLRAYLAQPSTGK